MVRYTIRPVIVALASAIITADFTTTTCIDGYRYYVAYYTPRGVVVVEKGRVAFCYCCLAAAAAARELRAFVGV